MNERVRRVDCDVLRRVRALWRVAGSHGHTVGRYVGVGVTPLVWNRRHD